MNPSFLLASIAAAIIGSAQAGYVYIYSPYAATVCQPGNPCPISWHVSNDGPEFSRVDIELLNGEAHSANVVAPIVLGYDLSQGNTFVWNVPQGVFTEGDYFIRIKGVGTDYQSYSHNFPIAFGPHTTVVPTVTPTGTTSAVTPTRTGSAISSSSSSSIRKTSTAAATSTSSAMSVQGSVSVAAAVVAAAFAIMMF